MYLYYDCPANKQKIQKQLTKSNVFIPETGVVRVVFKYYEKKFKQ